MKNEKRIGLFIIGMGLLAAGVEIFAEPAEKADAISIRKLDSQVVLYTIYRGRYDQIGQAIGKLFELAGQKGLMPPRGPVSGVYLNNPDLVAGEHWLTEIRIPVAEEALKAAGTLGEMVDVKKLPAMEAAVVRKPKGEEDPAGLYKKMKEWLHKNDYAVLDNFMELFVSPSVSGGYAEMETEIMVPVEKLPAKSRQ